MIPSGQLRYAKFPTRLRFNYNHTVTSIMCNGNILEQQKFLDVGVICWRTFKKINKQFWQDQINAQPGQIRNSNECTSLFQNSHRDAPFPLNSARNFQVFHTIGKSSRTGHNIGVYSSCIYTI